MIFRAFLVMSTAIFAVTYWLPAFDSAFYSEDTLTMRQWDGWGAVLPAIPLLNIALFIAGVAIPAFMFFFVSWSRAAFLVLTVGYALLGLGWGVRVATPADAFLGEVVALFDGAILTLAYFSSLAPRFSLSPSGHASV